MKQPSVSILLPFRDAADTLPECLESIARQTFNDYELIAVNDHSSDLGDQAVEKLSLADSRIRLVNNRGEGLVDALNTGLAASQGEIILRMDADDLMRPERIEKQYQHLQQKPEICLSATQVRLFPESEIKAGFSEYIRWQNECISPKDIRDQIYIESPFAHPSVAIRKEVLKAIGGYHAGLFPEDYDLWLRLYQAGYQMEKIPEVLLDWREHEFRLSRVDARCHRSAFDALRANYLARDPRFLEHRDHFVIWGAGRRTRQRCRYLLNQGFNPIAWIDIDPEKIGRKYEGTSVHQPEWLASQAKPPFVLIYVANHGARDLITEQLRSFGYQPGTSYLAVG